MKLLNKIKKWFDSSEITSLKLQVDLLDDVIKQLEKDLGKATKRYIASLTEKRQIKDELDKQIGINLENKTKYASLKYDYSKTLVFLENILNQVEDQVVGTSSYLDALVPPK